MSDDDQPHETTSRNLPRYGGQAGHALYMPRMRHNAAFREEGGASSDDPRVQDIKDENLAFDVELEDESGLLTHRMLRDHAEELEQASIAHKAELDSSKEEVQSMQRELDAAKVETEKVQGELEKANSAKEEAEKARKRIQVDLTAAAIEVGTLKGKLDEQDTETRKLRESLQVEIDEAETRADDVRSELQVKIDYLNMDINRLTKSIGAEDALTLQSFEDETKEQVKAALEKQANELKGQHDESLQAALQQQSERLEREFNTRREQAVNDLEKQLAEEQSSFTAGVGFDEEARPDLSIAQSAQNDRFDAFFIDIADHIRTAAEDFGVDMDGLTGDGEEDLGIQLSRLTVSGKAAIAALYREPVERFFRRFGLNMGPWPARPNTEIERFLDRRLEELFDQIKAVVGAERNAAWCAVAYWGTASYTNFCIVLATIRIAEAWENEVKKRDELIEELLQVLDDATVD